MSSTKDAIKKLTTAIKGGELSLEEEKVALQLLMVLQRKAKLTTARIQYPKLKEYYLRYTQNCVCCDSFFVRWYWMTDTRQGYLQAVPCSPITEDIKHKRKGDRIYSCPLCREVLMTKTVEELTSRLIQAYVDRRKIK